MIDLNGLQAAFASIPGYAVNKVLKKNAAIGTVRWAALEVADIPTLTSGNISDFTEAAQDAVGAMAANSSKVSLTYVDGTPSLTPDIVAGSLGPTDIANRTRKISLVWTYDRRAAGPVVYADDAHGSLNSGATWAHIDETDGNASYKILHSQPVVLPADFVSSMTFNWMWSSTAASNNSIFSLTASKLADTSTAQTSLLAALETVAAPGVANTVKSSSKAFASQPVAGDTIVFEYAVVADSGSDSNTGTRSLWGAWLEYTADS